MNAKHELNNILARAKALPKPTRTDAVYWVKYSIVQLKNSPWMEETIIKDATLTIQTYEAVSFAQTK